MKKKFISLVVFLFSIFFIGNIQVFAANNPFPISAHDIPSDTYIIGTHAFDENRDYLSTQDIMWAARTIDAESIDDMIIYYKDMNGVWVDGLTGENLTVPSTFKLEEVNSEKIDGVFINTVLEEYEIEGGGEGYTSINQADYNPMGFYINLEENKTDYNYDIIFDAYNIKDAEYNFDLQCHKYTEENDDFTPTPFQIGTIPTKITVSNGTFRLPVNINATDFDYVECSMELENNDETYTSEFFIAVNEPEASLKASAMGVGYQSEEGAGSGVMYSNDNTFYLINSEDLMKDIEFAFLSRYIEEGDYKLDVIVNKDGKEVNVESPETFIIGEGLDPVYGYSNSKINLTFEEQIAVGTYVFEIILYNSNDDRIVTEHIYLFVSDETKLEISEEVWEDPETYYSLNELVFKNGKKRKFNMTIFAENIPAGTYAVKAQLEYLDMVIPANFELKYTQNVQIKKLEEVDYFDFAFEIPKNAKVGENTVPLGVGKYFVQLTLHKLIEDDEFGGIIVSNQPIAKTGFTFTIESDIAYGDINLDGEIDIGDSLMVLHYVNGTNDLTNEELSRADVNNDGFINMVDAHLIQAFEAGYYPNTLPNYTIVNYTLYGDTLNSGDLFREESPQAYSVIEQYLNGNTEILTGQALKNADVNGDGVVNHIDKVLIYGYINELVDFNLPNVAPITEYILYGDVTNDGIIDTEDVIRINQYISGNHELSAQGIKNADINNDGNIDNTDYEIIQQGIADNIFEGNMPLFSPVTNNN